MKRVFQNPFLLVAQGFLAGAILFASTTPGISHAVLHHAPHFVAAAVQS